MKTFLPLAIVTTIMVAAPVTHAGADVKAGVDAWGRGDYPRAVQEWRGPAVAGDPDAQFNLAQAYKLGRGVPIDPAQALTWFKKAADQGHPKAQDNYGIALFESGRKADAIPWLEKSAARGEARTQLVLGTMLFNGDGVARDPARAYALLTRASQAGLESAGMTLAEMDQYLSPEDRQRGLKLAQDDAAKGGRPAPLPAPPPGGKRFYVPPTQVTAAGPRPAKVAATPAARGMAPKPVAGSGRWRIQLGAFRDRANAEALWNRVRTRLPGAQPAYVAAAGVTRLQATGFASTAEARRACTVAPKPCVVVAP